MVCMGQQIAHESVLRTSTAAAHMPCCSLDQASAM